MSPILGVWASAQQSAFVVTGSYESIATVTVGSGGTANVEFTSIPSTYKHLQLRISAQTNRVSYSNDSVTVRFNGVTTNSYYSHQIFGDGNAAATNAFGYTLMYYSGNIGSSAIGNPFGSAIIDILDYTSTSKNKTLRSLSGYDINGEGIVSLNSGFLNSTSAITSITLDQGEGTLFNQYSRFALYGIKG